MLKTRIHRPLAMTLRWLALPLMLTLAHGAHASDTSSLTFSCGAPAPAENAQGANGGSVHAPLLARLQTAKLRGIDGSRMRCFGTGSSERAVHWRFELEDLRRRTSLDGRIIVAAMERRERLATLSTNTSSRSRNVTDRHVDEHLASETIELPEALAWTADASTLSLKAHRQLRRAGADNERCLSATAERCNRSSTITTQLRMLSEGNAEHLEIVERHYRQGRLVERASWRLALDWNARIPD